MRKIVKKRGVSPFIIIFLLMLQVCGSISAQDRNNLDRPLRMIFIDHEPTLPSRDIIAYLRQQRTQALENDNSLIIYMPSNQEPFLVLVNLKDPKGKSDTVEAFGRLCEALNLPSHNKEAWFDREAVIDLFSKLKIIADDGNLSFASVRMEFYLTSKFWALGYNESIIAPIFFALDGKNLLQKNFNFDVYVNPEDRPTYNVGAPFGEWNLGKINDKISIFDYPF